MKLLHHTAFYFVGILMAIIAIWAVIFYYVMLGEIYDSIDDGLDNQKGLIIQKAATDTSVLYKNNFDETDYAIREIPAVNAVGFNDTYIDTMMYMQNEKSDEPVRLLKTVFLQKDKYYQLQIATSMVEEDDLIKQLLYAILWLYLGLIIIVIFFNNFLLKKIWQPFYQLLKQLKNFRLDKNDRVMTAQTRVNEFRMLNETVQGMLQRNIDTYNSQKNFIENAAHELQTPLAISINKLEALVENHSLPEEQLKLVAEVMDNLERLTRLNKSLLLLSKIENKQFIDETDVDINALIKQTIVNFSDQSSFSDLTINMIEKDNFSRPMNADLASVLVTNLIKNAIVHNKPGGFVNIILDTDQLIVENSGIDSPLDEQKIFNRFHTGQPSQTSTGLGLAIVKAIAALYNFPLSYHYDQKHIITIHF